MKATFYTFLAIVAVVGILKWSGHRDEQVNASMQAYEQCVQDEYGTTPAHWYAEHGELPPCQR